jgi:putative ABC transport system permease protein
VPLREETVGDVRPALLVLLGAVAGVLLIACTNVAHLLLARTAARQRELAVRAALGAGRWRVARQLVTESLVLAALGGAAGVLLAHLGVAALVRLAGDAVPRLEEVRVDRWALAFTAGAAAITGVLVAVAPALRASRASVAAGVREGTRGAGTGRRQHALQGALVGGEVAACLVLLVGAGLLLRSFQRLSAVDPGVTADGVLTALVVASPTKYPEPERQRAVLDAIAARVAALPGVAAVGLCDCMPPESVRQAGSVVIEGGEPDAPPTVDQIRAGANYFGALRIPVRVGRAFTAADRAGGPLVAVVNEAFARRHLAAGAGAAGLSRVVGRRVATVEGRWLTVVGVVADVRYGGLAAAPRPALYYPLAQDPFPGMNLFARVVGRDGRTADALELLPAVRRAVAEIDPEIAVARVATLDAVVHDAVARPRFQAAVLATFAALALTLAAVGVYGVVAYGVTQRRREVSVRLALGARPVDVLRQVVARALRPVWIGAAAGLAAAAASARVLAGVVYDTDVREPATYVAVAATLLAAATLAAYLPARRAAAEDPAGALRGD